MGPNWRKMYGLRKKLEKAWFSVLLFGFICIGVFRVFQDPEKSLAKRGLKDDVTSDSYHRDKQVTKPMEAGRRFVLSDHILFFNRVPKSGSEMLVLLLQWLQGLNGFRHVRLRGGDKRRLNLAEQVTPGRPWFSLTFLGSALRVSDYHSLCAELDVSSNGTDDGTQDVLWTVSRTRTKEENKRMLVYGQINPSRVSTV